MEQAIPITTRKRKTPHDGNRASQTNEVGSTSSTQNGINKALFPPNKKRKSQTTSASFTTSAGLLNHMGTKAESAATGRATQKGLTNNDESHTEVKSSVESPKGGSRVQGEVDRVKSHRGDELPSEVPQQSISLAQMAKLQSSSVTVNVDSVDIDPNGYPITHYKQSTVKVCDQSIIQWRDKHQLDGRSVAVLYLKSGFHSKPQITTSAMTSKMDRYRKKYYAEIGQEMPAKQPRGRKRETTMPKALIRDVPEAQNPGKRVQEDQDDSRSQDMTYEEENGRDEDPLLKFENDTESGTESDSESENLSSATVVGEEEPTAVAAAAKTRETTLERFHQVEEDSDRSINNLKGDTIIFLWCDNSGNRIPDAHPLTMRRAAAMQYSSILKENLEENPGDSTIEIDPNVTGMPIKRETCERSISCLSPTMRSTLPATDRGVTPEGTRRVWIQWTPQELFDLYFLAEALGSPHVCDMVTDRFKEMLASGSALPEINLSAIQKLVALQDKPAVMFWSGVFAIVLVQDPRELGYASLEQLPEVVRDMVAQATPEAAQASIFDEETYCAHYHHHGEEACYKVLAEKSKAEPAQLLLPATVQPQERSSSMLQKGKKAGEACVSKAKKRDPKKEARLRQALDYLQNMPLGVMEQGGGRASSDDEDSINDDNHMS